MDAIRYAIVSMKNPDHLGAHIHYSQSSKPRNNLNPLGNTPGTAPELQDDFKPKFAHTHVPRL